MLIFDKMLNSSEFKKLFNNNDFYITLDDYLMYEDHKYIDGINI